MKVYTKTGDNGTTGLFAGPRVAKDHPRIQAYGTVDELNAALGVASARLRESHAEPHGSPISTVQELRAIQCDLFSIGAQLSTPDPEKHNLCLLKEQRVKDLETLIDELEHELPPLTNFILPDGSEGAAFLHLARTMCRRTEREIVSLGRDESINMPELIIAYFNRLGDLLFVLARWINHCAGIQDSPWRRPEA